MTPVLGTASSQARRGYGRRRAGAAGSWGSGAGSAHARLRTPGKDATPAPPGGGGRLGAAAPEQLPAAVQVGAAREGALSRWPRWRLSVEFRFWNVPTVPKNSTA